MKVPRYGRKKADELIAKIRSITEQAVEIKTASAGLVFSIEDLLILNDMLYQMDKHLPDFFEGEDDVG